MLELAQEQRRAHREGSAMGKMCGKCAGCKVSAVDLLASAFEVHKSWFEVACQFDLVIWSSQALDAQSFCAQLAASYISLATPFT